MKTEWFFVYKQDPEYKGNYEVCLWLGSDVAMCYWTGSAWRPEIPVLSAADPPRWRGLASPPPFPSPPKRTRNSLMHGNATIRSKRPKAPKNAWQFVEDEA
jgi:hypothetical protein